MQTKYLLALNAHEKIGSQTLKKALASFEDSPEKLWKAGESEIRKWLDSRIAQLIIEARDQFTPGEEIEKLQKFNIGYITMYDKDYPKLLLETPDAPVILYIKGSIEVLNKPSIAIVGSRKFTNYGREVAYKMAKACSEAGLVVVSGLALGIDAVAHGATLDVNGITVGVLGCGLDRIYPATNLALGRSIIEQGGAIISEFPIGTPPLVHHFPQRNRIIAGLSLGTLVVEAAKQSGALITAYQALEYNREIFAVPGNINSEMSEGTNTLIQKGAQLVTKAEDVFEELNIEAKQSIEKSKQILPETAEEKIILDSLRQGEKLIDAIVGETKLNIIAVNSTLTMLEMKGAVSNLGGGRYKIR